VSLICTWSNRICFTDPVAINFDCNRALQQINGEHELQSGLDFEDDSGQPLKGPSSIEPRGRFPGTAKALSKDRFFPRADGGDLLFSTGIGVLPTPRSV